MRSNASNVVDLRKHSNAKRGLPIILLSNISQYLTGSTLQQSRVRSGNAIASYKAAQQIEAFESFLFMGLPMSFLGGELAILGRRALDVGIFGLNMYSKLISSDTNRVFGQEEMKP